MDWMDTFEELETIELLDIWNEEFGGIDIDWTGFEEFFAVKRDGDANDNWKELIEKQNVEKQNVERENVEKQNVEKENVEKENFEKEIVEKESIDRESDDKEKNVKAKRGRPRLKPLKPDLFIRKRDVSN
jgi:hypothetical protein